MQANQKKLFEQFTKLARSVKQDFKNKGLVVPSRTAGGDIQIGNYVIFKKEQRYYIRNKDKEVVAGPLNLAQTAVVVANDLALGRLIDRKLINDDAWYGYKEFDELVANTIAEHAQQEHDVEKAEFNQYKAMEAKHRKLEYKKNIDARYNKLCKLT